MKIQNDIQQFDSVYCAFAQVAHPAGELEVLRCKLVIHVSFLLVFCLFPVSLSLEDNKFRSRSSLSLYSRVTARRE